MTAAQMPEAGAPTLDDALDALARAYADAKAAIAAAIDERFALAGATRVDLLLRELGADITGVRATINADIRNRLINSAMGADGGPYRTGLRPA